MKDKEEKGNKKELEELLEKEVLFLDSLRQLQGLASRVFARPETLEKLAEEMKACETQIVKRYFFPIDKTIADFATLSSTSREEMIKTGEEDGEKLLRFIDILDKEVTKKEEEIKDFKAETKKLREMLINMS